MRKKYSVTIIGLGNIGLLYDLDSKAEICLTHLKSFFYNSSFQVINCIDKSEHRIKLAREKYGYEINYFKYFSKKIPITDLYVLSSIPEINKKLYNKINRLNKNPFFLIEKPAWINKKKSENCYVNYFRKTIPAFQKLKNEFESDDYGFIQSINCYYTKGLRNNGSHLIDLIFYFFGYKLKKNSFKIFNKFNDYSKHDETISFTYQHSYRNTLFPVTFTGLNEKMFSIIEMDIITQKHRIKIYEFGEKIEISSIVDDPLFPEYKKLNKIKTSNAKLSKSGGYVSKEIFKILNHQTLNNSNFENEKRIIDFINSIKKTKNG